MGSEESSKIEWLASEYYLYLRNDKTTGGSVRAKKSRLDSVTYGLGNFIFEADFSDQDYCEVTVQNGGQVKERIQIPYIHSNEVDWQNFFLKSCTLAQRLNK